MPAERIRSRSALAILAGALVVVAAACDRSTHSPAQAAQRSAPASESAATSSPADAIRACHAHRVSGRLRQAAEMVVPERRSAVLDLMLSVDRLTAANRGLERAVSERIGTATATLFSRPGVANIIGVFSQDVEVVSERVESDRVESDRAEVTIQVASRVPLERVTLSRRGGVWLIETDPPVPGLSEEIGKLAGVLTDVAREVRNRAWTADELASEINSRERAAIRRISMLIAASNPPAVAARSDPSAGP